MQNNQTKSKTLLAKILSQENISVQIVVGKTAMFDLKKRVLSIPEMKDDLPECLYNLFVGHEIAHALESPSNFMDYAKKHKLSHSLINIIEDVRIEKLIQRDYPGLRRDFIMGYLELLDRDFFGIKNRNVNNLGFLDRLNIRAKCGVSLGVTFTPREQIFVDMAFAAETWQDVVDTCIAIKAFLEEQPQIEFPEFPSDVTGDDDEPPDINWGDDGVPEEQEETTKDDSATESETHTTNQPSDDNPLDAKTFQSFESKKTQLYDADSNVIKQLNITSTNYKDFIISHKELASILATEIYMADEEWEPGKHDDLYVKDHNIFTPEVKQRLYTEYKLNNEAIIKYMVKEFNLKKNADIIKRTTIGKTGLLNKNKLFSFQFNDDIFLKKATVHEAQSHGLIIYVDWSASMCGNLFHSIQQLFCLLDFCRFVNIPFQVYAFNKPSREILEDDVEGYQDGDIFMGTEFQLLELFVHTMSLNEYTMMQKNLLLLAKYHYPKVDVFFMGGTPLNETIICAMDMIPDFQKRHNLQIVNTVFITDGDSNPLRYIDRKNITNVFDGTYYIEDEYRNSVKIHGREETTNKLLSLMAKRTNAKVVGFFLTEPDIEKFVTMIPTLTKSAILAEFTNNGSLVSTCSGYHEYYLINVKHLEVKIYKEAKTGVELIKQNRQTMKNRVIMNRFIDLIAKQPH